MNKLYHLMILFLAALMPFAASAQSGTVKGTVTDESGLPVIGAGVVVKGTAKGTITDIDGLYSIAAAQGQTLVFSSIGYVNQEIVVGISNEINVVLKTDTELLDEVVVVGYGVQKKVNLTGSVSVVESEDLVGRTSANTSNLLVGVVPNMNVTNDNGRPGDGSSINIRGVNSISSSAGPYVLIDGVEGNLDRVNPNDIESISVLKDASSAAISLNRPLPHPPTDNMTFRSGHISFRATIVLRRSGLSTRTPSNVSLT